MMSKLQEGAMGIAKTLCFPDRPFFDDKPILRKVARVALSLLIAGAGVGVFYFMTKRFDPATLADPSMSTIILLPACCALTGIGIGFAILDLIPEKYHQTAAKIASVLMPLLMVGATVALFGTAFHGGIATPYSMGGYFGLALLMIPATVYSVSQMVECLRTQSFYIYRNDDQRNPQSIELEEVLPNNHLAHDGNQNQPRIEELD